MRGDEEACFARDGVGSLVLREDRVYEGACAAFAFGAGYMHDFEAIQVRRLGCVSLLSMGSGRWELLRCNRFGADTPSSL